MCSMYRVLANATLLVNLRVVCCCCYNFTCIIAYQTIQYFSILGQDKISSVFCTPLCSRHDITVLLDTQSHWARKCTVKSEWIRLAFKTESCNRIRIVLRYWFENCMEVAQPCCISTPNQNYVFLAIYVVGATQSVYIKIKDVLLSLNSVSNFCQHFRSTFVCFAAKYCMALLQLSCCFLYRAMVFLLFIQYQIITM